MSTARVVHRGRPPADGQLRALVGLRWRMIRSPGHRWGLLALFSTPILLSLLGIFCLRYVSDDQSFNIAVATPTLYLGFSLLAIVAPLAAGGGYELYPSDQLVAYPLHPRTVFRSTLLLAPVNLAWLLNSTALVIVTAFAVGPLGSGTPRALVSVLFFIALVTVSGLAFALWVVGVRQTRRGRIGTWASAVLLVLYVLMIVRLDLAFDVLNSSPTKFALTNGVNGYQGHYRDWLAGLLVMLGGAAMAQFLGGRATAWALRRPGDHVNRDSSRPVQRRGPRLFILGEFVAIDRRSVWRSLPLRRGILVLLVLPGTVAALASMTWQSLVLLPGLVAAGAGMLFGINAFALDASGSLWLSTLPNWPRYAFTAKTIVLAEVALAAVGAALIGGSLRAPAPTSAADVTAAVSAAIACASLVVATGMRSSLRHPYRAELRGSRDTPAPPGVMALHSARLAIATTLVSLLFSAAALAHVWWIPVLLAVPVLALSGLSLIESEKSWEHPHVRAHIVATVSGG